MQVGLEIEFRAWDDEKKRMYDGDAIETYDYLVTGLSYGRLFVALEDPDWRELTVIQFTGLHDKKGKGIYEGDILADCVEGSTIRGYVVRQKGAFFLETGQKWAPYLHVIATKHNEISEWEVIGNIYENPELVPAA
ncbi:YopX family protein [Brevibacillus sp. NPDC003359]|uniref:YopX family protein n=1 Tax=unclassified Brevibacillus TaxID=2684853 RepID=UPI003685E1E7